MTKQRTGWAWTGGAAVMWLGLVVGCYPDDPCSEGQVEVRGFCVAADGGTDDGGATDGGDGGGTGVVQCEPTGSYDAFGVACESQSDCACPAGTCLEGFWDYCTEVNCMRTDEDGGMIQVCPPGWTCQSTAGVPGVPAGIESICLRPAS